ncbi:MAG: L-2-amino-thiazoline-4-carboxylic acid hydrolase [Synergistaceae bacterium]|nr:L-2-amino-thiazoline-4-carboxylic acid hydrolase [Synergistaceae bacterium]
MSEIDSERRETVEQIRMACRQFARMYFNFCKTLVEQMGIEAATPLIQRAIFNLSLDRTDRMRSRAAAAGLECTFENFGGLNDLPAIGWYDWTPEMGGVRCPYAEVWLEYFETNPWFKPLASLYCDVIDTTNIENFTQSLSHRITHNLLWGDSSCEREYFPSEEVAGGALTYGAREENSKDED